MNSIYRFKEDTENPFSLACLRNDLEEVDKILSDGGDVNCSFYGGNRPLHIAALQRDTRLAELLLKKGAHPNISNENKVYPLHLAADSENEEFVRLMINNYGADVNVVDNRRRTVLYVAANSSNKNLVRDLLLKHADPNKIDMSHYVSIDLPRFHAPKKIAELSYTALINAARRNNFESVELLLNYGAHVNAIDAHQKRAEFYAIAATNVPMFKLLLSRGANATRDSDLLNFAIYVNCKEIVEMLLDEGVDIQRRDSNGRTAFPFIAMGVDEYFEELNNGVFRMSKSYDFTRIEIVKFLLHKGINVNHRDDHGLTTLHWAARWGYVEVVEVLLKYKAEVNLQDHSGRTALHLSTDSRITQMLIQKGAKVNITDMRCDTPLHSAVRLGDLGIVETLMKSKANVNALDRIHRTSFHLSKNRLIIWALIRCKANGNLRCRRGTTPLHIAAQEGHEEIVELLLAGRAQVDIVDNKKRTALHYSRSDRITEMLLELGANPNIADEQGYTPLHIAVSTGCNKVVALLVKHNANLDARDHLGRTALHYLRNTGSIWIMLTREVDLDVRCESGETPLHVAARRGQVDIAEVLLEQNADPTTEDNHKWTPLHKSIDPEITRMLLIKGAFVDARTSKSDTPLHVAAYRGYTEIVKILLDHRASVDYKNYNQATPLHCSVQSGKVEVAELLLKKGAAVNAKYKDGKTALHSATTRGDANMMTLLLNYGADVNSEDRSFKTPIFYALHRDKFNIFTILLDHDSDINHWVPDNGRGSLIWGIENVHRFLDGMQTYREAFAKHVIKIQAMDRFVGAENLEASKSYFHFDENMEKYLHLSSKEEVALMKQHKIGNTVITPYDLLTKNLTRIAAYIIWREKGYTFNEARCQITEELFPAYYYMIIAKFEVVRQKVISWRHSKKCLNFILTEWITVDLPIEVIFNYLEGNDLQTLSQMCITED